MKFKHQIPFHVDQEKTFTIFFDEEEELFYRQYTKVNMKPAHLYSGITATILYALLSSLTFTIFSEIPIFSVLFSFFSVVIFLLLTIYFIKKASNQTDIHYFHIYNDRLYSLIIQGEKDLKKRTLLFSGYFLFNLSIMFALYTHPNELVLFLCHTVFWWILLLGIYTNKLFKRRKLYRQMKEQMGDSYWG